MSFESFCSEILRITRLKNELKFIYSEKATKLCEILTLLLTVCTVGTVVKSKMKISQNCVAFSKYMNFNISKNQELIKSEKWAKSAARYTQIFDVMVGINFKAYPNCQYMYRSTEVRFPSFLSGGFITAIIVNPPERKPAECTFVHSTDARVSKKAEKFNSQICWACFKNLKHDKNVYKWGLY